MSTVRINHKTVLCILSLSLFSAIAPVGFCEETTLTTMVNTYIQYQLDNSINNRQSRLALNISEDYTNFNFSYYHKFGYMMSPKVSLFSDVTLQGDRYDAFLTNANMGFEFVNRDCKITAFRRIYEKDYADTRKYYFTIGGKFQ
ncbi:hypothetical protein SCACP_33950 [Sporomusa carbonis]|uniref:hypothetical protein n=1 Tax=Sporomusa carbonis TaxID=3076075 RepID=UPI003A6F9864